MSDIRIFVCFDVVHDADLFEEFRAQADRHASGFALSGHSEPGSMSPRWEDGVRARVRAADEVIVICGEHTADSVQTSAELRIVQEEGGPYFLLWGRREIMCTRPVNARSDDSMYSWTAEILSDQITQTLRKANPPAVPEHLKRAPIAPRSS
jgi:hypothetical protein